MSDTASDKSATVTEFAWAVAYETAILSRWPTESGAWVAHDRAVIQGLDPDKLAVVPLKAVRP